MSKNGFGPPDYSLLHKASVSYEYLHTNSTTHVFVFGAIAELVDNARDANAKTLNIDFDPKQQTLSFHDDGVGMSPDELMRVVTFGHSLKKHEVGKIGQYGNGLKSGAMRIARNFIIFTKKGDFCSALLLSRSFHEKSGIRDILVPTPVLTTRDMKPAEPYNEHKHMMEMSLIYEHSPFKSQREFLAQFDKINGDSGTIIVLFDLRMIESGAFELDFKTDNHDIKLTDHEIETEEERNSLRAYLAVLYLNPYTKIYLRGQKVNTVRILSNLTNTYFYLYAAKNLKSCAENEYKNCQRRTVEVSDELKQAKSEYGMLMNEVRDSNGGDITSREAMSQARRKNMKISDLTALLAECRNKEEDARKAKSKPAPLKFSYGLNIHHRNRYGCMVYNNGRLIDMYVKLASQRENKDLFMRCLGVVGVVDISYSILEPTHNKQSFENKREYTHLLKAINDHLEQYWDDVSNIVGRSPDEVRRFWADLGYEDCNWGSECNKLEPNRIKRFQKTNHCIQCDKCLKWRMVPFQRSYVDRGIPPNWSCANHPNTASRSCDLKENLSELVVVKKGILSKRKNTKPVEHPARCSLISSKDIKREPRQPPPMDPSPTPPLSAPPSTRRQREARFSKPAVIELSDSDEEPLVPATMRKSDRGAPPMKQEPRDEIPYGRRKNAETKACDNLIRKGTAAIKKKPGNRRKKQTSDESSDDEEEEAPRKRPVIVLKTTQRTSPQRVSVSAKRTAVIESEEEEDMEEEDSEPVPQKKARTKADLRKQMQAASSQMDVTLSPVSSVRSGSSSVRLPLDPNLDIANKAKRQLRAMLRKLFIITGNAKLGELLKKSDDELLKENLEQAMVNLNTSEPAKRQVEDDLRAAYPTTEHLASDLIIILNWLTSNDEPRPKQTAENCFLNLRNYVDQLRDLDFSEVQEQPAEEHENGAGPMVEDGAGPMVEEG